MERAKGFDEVVTFTMLSSPGFRVVYRALGLRSRSTCSSCRRWRLSGRPSRSLGCKMKGMRTPCERCARGAVCPSRGVLSLVSGCGTRPQHSLLAYKRRFLLTRTCMRRGCWLDRLCRVSVQHSRSRTAPMHQTMEIWGIASDVCLATGCRCGGKES